VLDVHQGDPCIHKSQGIPEHVVVAVAPSDPLGKPSLQIGQILNFPKFPMELLVLGGLGIDGNGIENLSLQVVEVGTVGSSLPLGSSGKPRSFVHVEGEPGDYVIHKLPVIVLIKLQFVLVGKNYPETVMLVGMA